MSDECDEWSHNSRRELEPQRALRAFVFACQVALDHVEIDQTRNQTLPPTERAQIESLIFTGSDGR
jgi:hypothetical protein